MVHRVYTRCFGEAERGVAEFLSTSKTSQHTLPYIIPHITIPFATKTKKHHTVLIHLRLVLHPLLLCLNNKKTTLLAQKKRIFSTISNASIPLVQKKIVD
jgi:hypothetical protein